MNAPASIVLRLTNLVHNGTAQTWQLTSTNAITHLPDAAFSGNTFSNQVPAQSITLFVLPGPNSPHLRAGVANVNGSFDLWLDGIAAQRYIIQTTTNFSEWAPLQTNTLASNSLRMTFTATNAPFQFYRALWSP